MKDSQGRLCSRRRAPPPAFVSAQQLDSRKPGGRAAFPGTSAGLFGISACSDHNTVNRGSTENNFFPAHFPQPNELVDVVYFRELLYVCKTGCNVIAQISVVKVLKGLTPDLLKKIYIYHDIYIKEPCQ